MWELRLANPLGTLTVRKITSLLAAFFVACFVYLATTPQMVHAQSPDATWKDGSIEYQNEIYRGPNQATANDQRQLPEGTIYYSAVAGQKMKIIYFPANSDPGAAASGTYVDYDLGAGGGLTNKSSTRDVRFNPTSAQQQQAGATPPGQSSSCKVDGIGWIICPVTGFFAEAMDWIFERLAAFLEVRPLMTTENNNPMLGVWNIMRSFANVAFVIAFLIIIYSQLTSQAVSNYGIKKLLPRLIIAAILVNVSYWLCAILIDVSNILGYSFQSLFINIRNSLPGLEGGNTWQLVSWQNVVESILAGTALSIGALVAANGAAATIGAAGITGGIYLALPFLVAAALTVLVVLVVLAIRQALITLLVVLAPLAFVAYILPNTEQWFNKWKDLFMTLLIMFPAFSLIFGGSQLAGLLIIQNAKDISVVLLGMAVQIAPLAITPLVIKLSGNLVSRIAGFMNNPEKGLVDRTRNWTKDRKGELYARQMAKNRRMEARGKIRPYHLMRKNALRLDNQRRMREGLKSIDEQDATSLFSRTNAGRTLHQAEHVSHQFKEKVENEAKAHIQQEINLRGSRLHLSNLSLEASKVALETETTKTDADTAEYKAGRATDPATGARLYSAIQDAMVRDTDQTAINALRAAHAKNVQNRNVADRLIQDEATRNEAGGILEHGAESALASAVSTYRKDFAQSVENAHQLSKHFNLSGKQRQDFAMGLGNQEGTDGKGNKYTFNVDDIYAREAAIETQVSTGTLKEAQQIIEHSGSTLAEFRTTISETMAKSGLSNKAVYMGGQTIDRTSQGELNPGNFIGAVQDTIAKGKIKSETLVTNDEHAIRTILEAAQSNDTSHMSQSINDYRVRLSELKELASYALEDDMLKGQIASNVKPLLEELRNLK